MAVAPSATQTAMKGDVWSKKRAIRLAINASEWNPTETEWNKAMRCIQAEERERIRRFRYQIDAKASLVGRLLMQFWAQKTFVSQPIRFLRSDRGRPQLAIDRENNWDFNVSHAGSYTVFVAQQAVEGIGVDVMRLKDSRLDDSEAKKTEFFRIMRRQFTIDEWNQIGTSLPSFFRFWTLKEAYVKAMGTGLNFDLQRLSFNIKSPIQYDDGVMIIDSVLFVNGQLDNDWTFEETLLGGDHWVSTALKGFEGRDFDGTRKTFDILNCQTLLQNLTEDCVDVVDPSDEWLNYQEKVAVKPF